MKDLFPYIKPILHKMDAETAHALTIRAMKAGLAPRYDTPLPDQEMLEQTLWGLKFPNPVGLAAGFDKNAEALSASFGLGFGFVEVGTVTPKPQRGNPRPRVFRDPDTDSVINAMGFPNGGMTKFKANLEEFLGAKQRPAGAVGINIGMNKSQKDPARDYQALIRMLAPMADYITVNISSPNTPGLRDLQKREFLLELVDILRAERKKSCGNDGLPILFKFSPDLTEEQTEELAFTASEAHMDGLILTNTTLDRPDLLERKFAERKGGLSGGLLHDKSIRTVKQFYTLTRGQIPIIGVGGISNSLQALNMVKAGASLVQLYSGLVFEGPSVIHSIKSGMIDLLKTQNYVHISDAIGADVNVREPNQNGKNEPQQQSV